MFDRNGTRKYLNRAERSAYFQAICDETEASRRAFFLTLVYTGCRISEGLNLQVERIDLAAKAVGFETLNGRKRGHFRSVAVPDRLPDLFQELLKGKKPEAKIWAFSRPLAYRMIKRKMHQASIQGKMACPKGLRHGHAVACVSSEIPPPTIQKWLGHARLETTAIYLEVHGEEERELAKRVWRA